MSGGTAVQTERHGSGAGAGEAEPRFRGFRPEVTTQGLVLTGDGAAKPPNEEEVSAVHGWQEMRKG